MGCQILDGAYRRGAGAVRVKTLVSALYYIGPGMPVYPVRSSGFRSPNYFSGNHFHPGLFLSGTANDETIELLSTLGEKFIQ